MTNLEVFLLIAVLLILIGGGVILYLALMAHVGNMEALMDAEVKRFRPIPEIRHKEWQKRGLMAPLQPQETPEYSFSDLQMNLYNTIYL